MLARQLRLIKTKDFKRIFKLGKAYHAKIFRLKVLANESETNRYGIVISSKVSKKAVERNKLKRQFRRAVKQFDKRLFLGFDLVIIVFPAALSQDYKFIESQLKKTLFIAKLLRPDKFYV